MIPSMPRLALATVFTADNSQWINSCVEMDTFYTDSGIKYVKLFAYCTPLSWMALFVMLEVLKEVSLQSSNHSMHYQLKQIISGYYESQ